MRQNFICGILSFSLILLAFPCLAEPSCVTANSNMSAGKVSLYCLKAKGDLKFNGTTIVKNLEVTGSLTATAAKLNSLTVQGDVDLENSLVAGPVQIVGALRAKNTVFKGDLDLTGKTVSLTGCKTKNLILQRPAKSREKVVLNLENTLVEGEVKFVGGEGTVVNKNSQLSGKVINGKD